MSIITGAIGAEIGGLAAGTFGWTAATWTQIGWTAGVMLGNYLFQPDGPNITQEGPRLNDLKVTTSTYGMDIPKVYGAYRISGNIIWALPLQETRHEETQEEGKGGGGSSSTSIWYTYKATFAVALCEGEITGIRKIWFGSKLIYNNNESSFLENITVYNGSSTQEIDPTMEAKYEDTPAYRHIAYIVFNDIELEDFGNVIPNVTAEVVKSGNITIERLSDLELPKLEGYDISGGKVLSFEGDYINLTTQYYSYAGSRDILYLEKTLLANTNYHKFIQINQYIEDCGNNDPCYMARYNIGFYDISAGSDYGTIPIKGTDEGLNVSDRWVALYSKTNYTCCESENFLKRYEPLPDGSDSQWYKDKYFLNADLGFISDIKQANKVYLSHGITRVGGLIWTHLSVYNDLAYVLTTNGEDSTAIISIYDEELNLVDQVINSNISLYYHYMGVFVVDYSGYNLIRGSSTAQHYVLDDQLNIIQERSFYSIGSLTGDNTKYHKGIIYRYIDSRIDYK